MIPMSSEQQPRTDATANFAEARRRMVQDQLRRRGVNSRRVLAAMAEVPREEFVPESLRADAYADCALPIGLGQTISQPFTVAYMLGALELGGSENVLEIGTGSGYGAAVLSRLAREVHTVERIPELAQQAKLRVSELGYGNIHVHLADGTLGLLQHAPFDAIVVTAGAKDLPDPYRDQLADQGRMVIPIGTQGNQALFRFTKRGRKLIRENLGGFAFVPLIGRHGGSEPICRSVDHAKKQT